MTASISTAREYCEFIAAAVDKLSGGTQRTMEGWLVAHGAEFRPRPFAQRGKARECFRNAHMLATGTEGWRYAEGIATCETIPGLGIHHAWAVDENGRAVEATWSEPGNSYFGVALSAEDSRRLLLRSERWGFLPRWTREIEGILKAEAKS